MLGKDGLFRAVRGEHQIAAFFGLDRRSELVDAAYLVGLGAEQTDFHAV